MNSGLLEAGSEADHDKNDARARPAATDTGAGSNTRTELLPTHPGPFQDIPRGIWTMFVSAWALLFTLFILFFAVTAVAAFVVTVAALFGAMAFGLPAVMAAQGRCDGHECRGMIQTRTGPMSVAAAGTQIVLIPVAAVMGLTAFIIFAL